MFLQVIMETPKTSMPDVKALMPPTPTKSNAFVTHKHTSTNAKRRLAFDGYAGRSVTTLTITL